MKKSALRSPLSIVRGLGSAKDGTGHFIMQRVTAIVLIPLSLWFVFSVVDLAIGAVRGGLNTWLSSGFHAAFLIIMLLALFYHAKIGMQVIIEDYVHCPYLKFTALFANAAVMLLLAVVSVLAVIKLNNYSPIPFPLLPHPSALSSHIILAKPHP